jgi:hypothetical protein
LALAWGSWLDIIYLQKKNPALGEVIKNRQERH